uniref:PGG domain-containing protein n=1 Tax=Triticum urartu TaxID=4572 RepID=A0A8R7UYR3_TRIUA
MAGDPILMATHYRRYLAFYYCNATALAASLVVSLILVILPKNSTPWTVVLQMVMVLDLLGLMGAYGAGSCRDAFTTIYAVAAFSFSVLVIISVFLSFLAKANRDDAISSDAIPITTNGDDNKVHPKSLCNLMKIGIVKLFEKGVRTGVRRRWSMC